jgi:hypothetical protein
MGGLTEIAPVSRMSRIVLFKMLGLRASLRCRYNARAACFARGLRRKILLVLRRESGFRHRRRWNGKPRESDAIFLVHDEAEGSLAGKRAQ